MKTSIAMLSFLLILAGAAHAGMLQSRQYRQDCRIEHGVQHGWLTPREQRALQVERRQLDRIRYRGLADGVIVPAEARQLARAQARVERDIYRLTHNNW